MLIYIQCSLTHTNSQGLGHFFPWLSYVKKKFTKRLFWVLNLIYILYKIFGNINFLYYLYLHKNDQSMTKTQKETWKTVQWRGITYPNHLVSTSGIVVTKNHIGKNKHKAPLFGEWYPMSYKLSSRKYYEVFITQVGGKRVYPRVHQLVWESYNGEVPKGFVIDHCDGDKYNNNLSNLQLLTPKENTIKYHKIDKVNKK